MLSFKTTNIVFIILLAMLLFVKRDDHFPWLALMLLVIVYTLIVGAGSYFIQSQFFLPAVCSGATNEKKLALSFDDGPAVNYTPEILAILRRYQVQAAFFCIGKNIAGNEVFIKQANSEGHIIGNHSFSHSPFFDFFTCKKMQADINSMEKLLTATIGKRPLFFRPPFGVTTPVMKKVLATEDYTAIGWNIRSYDTMFASEQKLYERVVARIKPGAIILFHDTIEITTSVLPRVIEYAQSNGYTFVRPDKLINLPAYA
jgi:peptidoglycan/xylan/chitin deacetylase (PgdA/CDA1 family)